MSINISARLNHFRQISGFLMFPLSMKREHQKEPPGGVLKKKRSENEELQSNFFEITLRHVCSSVNLLHIFRTPFHKNISGGLLLSIDRKGTLTWKGLNWVKGITTMYEIDTSSYIDIRKTLMTLMVSLTYTLNKFWKFLICLFSPIYIVPNCTDEILLISRIPPRNLWKKLFLKARNSDF